MNVIETVGLGRRYGSRWALQDCDVAVPRGQLTALVGPNGAGKSTLLNLVVGLTKPTAGQIRVLGKHAAGSTSARDAIAFVAQDTPLYRHLTVADMIHVARNLNAQFDTDHARRRVADLGIGERQRCGRLSGGQRAQLALTLALARHPRVLILDEPTAALDPLARHDFMATVMAAMADGDLTVVLSSHLLAELERVADHLILVSRGRVRLAGQVEDLTAHHRVVTSPPGYGADLAGCEVINSSPAGAVTHRVVRLPSAAPTLTGIDLRAIGIEELAMAYLREGRTHPEMTGALQ